MLLRSLGAPLEFDKVLYMQTAAEYQAVCLQTYNLATELLRQKLAAASHASASVPAERRPQAHIPSSLSCSGNRTLKSFAFLSSLAASYAVSVRRASVLPTASSGFHLAMDTLAVRLTIPLPGS
jgi:hypothetical protein